MNHNPLISESIFSEVVEYLAKIEQEHDVVVLQAIERGFSIAR